MSQTSIIKKINNANRSAKIIGGLVCIVFAILIAVGLLPQHTKYYLASRNVFATPTDSYKKDQFYRGKTYSIYDWFAENSDGRFYLCPAVDDDGNDAYLIVYMPKKFESKADKVMEQTWAYLESGDESLLKESINCRGYIDEINPKTMVYLNEYFDAAQAPASVRNQVADKMFVMVPMQKVILSEASLYIFLELVLLVCGLWLILTSFISKKHLKKIDNRLSRESMTASDLDAEFRTPVLQFGTIYVSDKHVVTATIAPQILTIADVVWMYPNKVNQVNSKPIYQAVFFTKNHECLRFVVKDENQAEVLCKAVHEKQPRALYGYVIENSQMYYSNFDALLAQVYKQDDGQTASSVEAITAETASGTEAETATEATAETNEEEQV
ncbi:MAG: hypothetical protein J5750_06575 [Clostridiales bacterium]|nr:hypothetical protein [Clostridiales bacterium]